MRATLASLCVLGLLIGCERRNDQEAATDRPRSDADTMTTSTAAADAATDTALTWAPVGPALPTGARAAVVEGDPTKPGPFILRLDLPDGYEVRPHHHPTAERVRVIEGTLMVGHGKQWADDKMQPLAARAEGTIPAKQPHYVRAKGKTLIEVRSTGPFEITYENPADDPRKKPVP
jgi:mannose-6-phosphate isomerase-like protein (cupin superfamily)